MTPDNYTIEEFYLDVGNGHQIYVQDWGNKDAKTPIFFLHGGPGSGCNDGYKQNFDPKQQRVIFHDQRGSGKSIFTDLLAGNTTDSLVEDISKIAERLQIARFIFVGGSWGSCLALRYGIAHPEKVAGMVVRGIFTGAQDEIDWLEDGGSKHFYPEIWERYLASVPENYRQNPSVYHFKMVAEGSPEEQKRSAYAHGSLEHALISLDDRFTPGDYETFNPNSALIEMHFLRNGCFMTDNLIFESAEKLVMPIWLVQGRYDMVCAPSVAYRLHKVLPNSQLAWTIAGHSGSNRSNYDLLRNLTLQMSTQL